MSWPVQCVSGLSEADSMVKEFLPSFIWKKVGLLGCLGWSGHL
jgi:hypothetical protein